MTRLSALTSASRGSEHLDQLVNALDHDGWWRVFRSLRARQNNDAAPAAAVGWIGSPSTSVNGAR